MMREWLWLDDLPAVRISPAAAAITLKLEPTGLVCMHDRRQPLARRSLTRLTQRQRQSAYLDKSASAATVDGGTRSSRRLAGEVMMRRKRRTSADDSTSGGRTGLANTAISLR
jgi:hypothetical protein